MKTETFYYNSNELTKWVTLRMKIAVSLKYLFTMHLCFDGTVDKIDTYVTEYQ